MTTATNDPAELRRLRRELKGLVESHPPSTWSPGLLAVVVNAIGLQFGQPADEPPISPRLRLVT